MIQIQACATFDNIRGRFHNLREPIRYRHTGRTLKASQDSPNPAFVRRNHKVVHTHRIREQGTSKSRAACAVVLEPARF
jgi:hypothetical protein